MGWEGDGLGSAALVEVVEGLRVGGRDCVGVVGEKVVGLCFLVVLGWSRATGVMVPVDAVLVRSGGKVNSVNAKSAGGFGVRCESAMAG